MLVREPLSVSGFLHAHVPAWSLSEKEFRRAIQLNPNYATAHHWYAFYCADLGRADEAVSEIREAQRLDPLSVIINADVANVFYLARRYDESIAQSRKTWEIVHPLARHSDDFGSVSYCVRCADGNVP